MPKSIIPAEENRQDPRSTGEKWRRRESNPRKVTSEPHDPSTVLHGWLLALRDLTDQGATAARVTLPGDHGPVHVYYSPGRGGKVITAAGTLDVPDSALDETGLEVARPSLEDDGIPDSLRDLVAAGVLRERAAKADGEYRRDQLESERNLARHRRRQAQHTRDVSARRADKTLGTRLDEALAGLLTIATVSAAPLGGDRVQGGEKASQPPWTGDPHGTARNRAYKLVQEIEGMLDTARTRDVQKAA